MMEDQQLHQSQDPRDSIVRNMKTEAEEEVSVKKEEEFPLQISPNPRDSIVRNVKTEEEEAVMETVKEEDIPLQISSDPGDSIVRNQKTEEEEEAFVKKEEEFPLQISSNPGDSTVRNVKTEEEEAVLETVKEKDIPLQISSDPGDSIVRNVKTEEEEAVMETVKEEDIPLQISSGQRSILVMSELPESLSIHLSGPVLELAMDALEEKLIDCVRQHPELYDTSNARYLKTKLKHARWMKIANELHKNVGEVKSCWFKLRSQHRDALRRRRRSFYSGAAAKPCKPWRFQKQMEFLVAYMVSESRDTNFAVEKAQAHPLPEESAQDLESPNQSFHAALVETFSAIEAQNESMESSASALTRIVGKPSAARLQKKSQSSPLDDMLLHHVETAKQRAEQRQELPEDSLNLFFKSLYQQIKKLHHVYQMELKEKIIRLVDEYKMMSLANPVPPKVAQYHQLQTVVDHGLPGYNFPCQAEDSFPPPSIPFAIPSATPSTSTEGVHETSISSVLHQPHSSDV